MDVSWLGWWKEQIASRSPMRIPQKRHWRTACQILTHNKLNNGGRDGVVIFARMVSYIANIRLCGHVK